MPPRGGDGHLPPICMAVTSSFVFTMPVATPPDASVFPSGWITIPQMFWDGIVLDFGGLSIVPATVYTLGAMPFG